MSVEEGEEITLVVRMTSSRAWQTSMWTTPLSDIKDISRVRINIRGLDPANGAVDVGRQYQSAPYAHRLCSMLPRGWGQTRSTTRSFPSRFMNSRLRASIKEPTKVISPLLWTATPSFDVTQRSHGVWVETELAAARLEQSTLARGTACSAYSMAGWNL
jgi:hypothetical protein